MRLPLLFVAGLSLLGVTIGPLPAHSQPAAGDVIINEVLYAPSPSTNEFIELYNRSDTTVALSALSFADANQTYVPVTSADTSLESGAYAVLVRDAEAFAEAFPDVSFVSPNDWPALNNGGDTVYLRHTPSGTSLDSVPYAPSWGGDEGQSLERIDPAGPSNAAANFASSEASTGATPGTQNSVYDPDETPPAIDDVIPSDGGDSLTVIFSEPVAPTTVSAEAFELKSGNAPAVTSASVGASTSTQVQCVLESSLSTDDYTLVVSGVADPRGNVLDEATFSFSYFVPETPAPGDVVISELQYAPPPAESEFIEVYNRSRKTVDLGALRYADANRNFAPVAPPLTALRPGEYAVLVEDDEAFADDYPTVEYLAPDGWDALNNGGDTVVLRHSPSATDVDAVPYAPSWGGTDGRSLERIDPRGPSDQASNFASSTAPGGATPGAQNSRFAPDTVPPRPVFAGQVDSLAVAVVFSEPVRSETIRPQAFQLGGTSVTRTSLRADSIARLTLSEAPAAGAVDVSAVRDPVGNRLNRASVPLALRPTPESMIINELMYDPRADDFDDRPNQVEYVEVYNRGDVPLTLTGLTLTDRPTEAGTADTLRIGRRRRLAPGGYAVVAAAPDGPRPAPESQLAAAFPEAALGSDSVAYLPVKGASLGLRNEGDRVRLHRRDERVVADVVYSPDWHAEGLADPTGTALERISPTAAARDADNWTSSTAPLGGTPGAPNDVSLAPPDDAPEAPGLRIHPSPFSIAQDGATRIQYTLEDAPSLIRVRIYDARGRHVRSLEEAQLAGRSGELVWNGRNDAGERVRIGPYVVLFEAVRAEDGTTTQIKETVVVARAFD